MFCFVKIGMLYVVWYVWLCEVGLFNVNRVCD